MGVLGLLMSWMRLEHLSAVTAVSSVQTPQLRRVSFVG